MKDYFTVYAQELTSFVMQQVLKVEIPMGNYDLGPFLMLSQSSKTVQRNVVVIALLDTYADAETIAIE